MLHQKTRHNSRAIATRLPNSIANEIIAMAKKHNVSISEFLGNMITNCYTDWNVSESEYKIQSAIKKAKKSSVRIKLLRNQIDEKEVGAAGEQRYTDWNVSESDHKRQVALESAKKSLARIKVSVVDRIDEKEVGAAGEHPARGNQSDRSDESPIGGNTNRDFWKSLGFGDK
jgi:uncharacterized protein YejL (UPF0352 family)